MHKRGYKKESETRVWEKTVSCILIWYKNQEASQYGRCVDNCYELNERHSGLQHYIAALTGLCITITTSGLLPQKLLMVPKFCIIFKHLKLCALEM